MLDRLYAKFPWLYKRHRLFSMLPKGSRILDIGCGPGKFLYRFFLTGGKHQLYGLDRNKCLIKEVFSKVCFATHDLNDLPLPYEDNYFDAVLSTHVIEHLKDPLSLFKEAYRILKPSGFLYVETPNTRSLTVDFPFLSFLDRNHRISWLNFYDDLEHIVPSSQMRLYKFCSLAGFKEIKNFIARNYFAVVSFPIMFILAIFGKGKGFGYALGHVIGTSGACIARK